MNSISKNSETSQTDETIQQLESYIKDFWRFLPLPICYLNPLHLLLDADQETQKFLKYSASEIIGESIEKIIIPEKNTLEEFKKEILSKGLVNGKRMLVMTKEKEKIPVNIFAMARRDENNEIIGYFVAISDMRESEKMQSVLELKVKERTRELEESKKELLNTLEEVKVARKKAEEEQKKIALIISNFSDPIIVVDRLGSINLFNPSAKDILKISEKSLGVVIDRKNNYSLENFREVVGREFIVKNNKDLKSDDRNIEEAIIKIDNEEQVYKVITSKVISGGREDLGTMKIFYNLTREKRIDRLKSEFISIAAHQLRTPLSAIKWSIKLVLDEDAGSINHEQKEMLAKGYSSNERMIALVNDMLNVSRIEEGRFGYSFSKGDFLSALNIVLGSLEPEIKSKNISLIINKPDEIPPVLMDKEKVTLVLQNLVENAIKYSPEQGKVFIDIGFGKNSLVFKIKDNGVGIPKEDKKKLFSKFFRANNVIRMQTEGSGLGLFICKNVIESHKGKISCISEEGKGSEFCFTLPTKN